MPALVESEEEEEEDTEGKDPLPEKLQNSMVTEDDFLEIKCLVRLSQLRKHKHNFPLNFYFSSVFLLFWIAAANNYIRSQLTIITIWKSILMNTLHLSCGVHTHCMREFWTQFCLVCDYRGSCTGENEPPAAFYSINGDCEALNCSAAVSLIPKNWRLIMIRQK